MTAKLGIIPRERETVQRGIMKDSINEQRRALGGSKEERFRMAIDDIEGASCEDCQLNKHYESDYEGRDSKFYEKFYQSQLQYFVEQGMRVTKDRSHKQKGSKTEIKELKYTDQLLERLQIDN